MRYQRIDDSALWVMGEGATVEGVTAEANVTVVHHICIDAALKEALHLVRVAR